MFAKLYETEEFGQILVKLDQSDGDYVPEVRIYFVPEGLGVCASSVKYEDSDDGRAAAEKYFNEIDQSTAMSIVNGIVQSLKEADWQGV